MSHIIKPEMEEDLVFYFWFLYVTDSSLYTDVLQSHVMFINCVYFINK